MSDTYYDSAHGVRISRSRAVREFKEHGLSESEFNEYFTPQTTYLATDVLDILGY